tara:strand:- start:1991 stop:2461 length:471 start_codon:yes stop_codon:yes gene_type:complete
MKKVSLDTWIQLLGMLGLLGGLVFVGLEMQQSQNIALAAQQQSRMEVFVEAMNTFSETGVSYQAFLEQQGRNPETETQTNNFNHQLWWIHENDYLQYRLGLMDESIWEAKLRAIKMLYNGRNAESCILNKRIWETRRVMLDDNLVELVESLPNDCP